jgi:hypothetical protein
MSTESYSNFGLSVRIELAGAHRGYITLAICPEALRSAKISAAGQSTYCVY